MDALVVYESVYGNTRAVAEAIAEGLGGAPVVPVSRAGHEVCDAELVVAGAPTHMHGLPSSRSRRAAADAAHENGRGKAKPGATDDPGMRMWLRQLSMRDGSLAAAFDTRLDRSPWLTGAAARGIARRLRDRGYEVLGTESFFVQDTEGPLEDGELERARAWGESLARSLRGWVPSAAGSSGSF